MIEYEKLRLSLKRLDEQHANYRQDNRALPDLDREGIAKFVMQRFELREAFEENNLPFRVDLFVWDEAPETFRKQIAAQHVLLRRQTARAPNSDGSHLTDGCNGGGGICQDWREGAYHAWRDGADAYEDLPGFCKSAPLDEVRRHGHVLTPGRYVGAVSPPDDGEPFEAKMQRLVAELHAQQAEGARLDAAIAENLKALGSGLPKGQSSSRGDRR